jgi:hypothetical protein
MNKVEFRATWTPDKAKVGSIAMSKHPMLTGQPHWSGRIVRLYKILRAFYWTFDVKQWNITITCISKQQSEIPLILLYEHTSHFMNILVNIENLLGDSPTFFGKMKEVLSQERIHAIVGQNLKFAISQAIKESSQKELISFYRHI